MTTYSVTDGVTSTSITLLSGDEMLVSSGGVAIEIVVSSGGREIVYSSGTANFTTVSNGGFELVSSGGTAISTAVGSGGTATISSDGAASFTVVSNSGTEVVSAGGSAVSTTVSSRGTETVSSSGTASFTTVSSGGYEIVSKGGVASFTTISFGGTEDVSSGGTTSFATVSGGTEYVYSGGTASFTVDEGNVFLDGGTAIDTTVSFGGVQIVNGGGRAISTTVSGASDEYVYSNGTASFTIVSANGAEILSDGTTVSTTVTSDGVEDVYSGGRAISTTLEMNGSLDVASSGRTSDTTVNSGGFEIISNRGGAISTTLSSGATEVIFSGGIARDTVMDVGATMNLTYLSYTAGGSASVNSSGLLTVSVGGQTYTQQLAGQYTSNYILSQAFNYSGDGTYVTSEAPCYRSGTRILTSRGDVAVEDLRIGDLVRTVVGETTAPIVWIGHRQVDCAHHPKPRQIWPIRVTAGAFGPGQPHTELFLSPDHAVYVNAVLIPVKHLINGSTIVQVLMERVSYYHIELPRHDVLLAEGLPTESFLDMRDGTNYANRPGPVRLYPDFSTRIWEAFGCARLIVTGAEPAAVRALVGRFAAERDAA
jgi:autotransporter passenger strand-loop-strand repeat protein